VGALFRPGGVRPADQRQRALRDQDAALAYVRSLREDRRELLAALAALPPGRREAIVLRYWLDLSEREMADTIRVSAGVVNEDSNTVGLNDLCLAR
jgi:DNA-directed RNA polymerase specialized sigma24 family protein